MKNIDIIQPSSVIGMLGDGQLGKMSALAGAYLGYKFAVLGPIGRDSSAGQVAWWAETWGDGYSNDGKIEQFAYLVCTSGGVVTLEWENVPLHLIARLEALGVVVRPGANVLKVAQDRLLEKECATQCGIPTANYLPISTDDELRFAHAQSQFPAILKTRCDGYDGKGQIRVMSHESLAEAWDKLKNVPCVLEEVVDFDCEVSVIIARRPLWAKGAGSVVMYGPIRNMHRNGILYESQYPAFVSEAIAEQARKHTLRIADLLELHGLLTIEFFVSKDGRVLFNEMAPRPHNSGHFTIECCHTSQFAQHIRAICNLPWGDPGFHSAGRMVNTLGSDVENWETYTNADGKWVVHTYGKDEAKEGRKMGHRTQLLT